MLKKLFIHWFIVSFVLGIFFLILPFYLQDIGYGENSIGQVYFWGGLISAFAVFGLSSHSDMIGRKKYLFLFGLMCLTSIFLFYMKITGFFWLTFFILLLHIVSFSRWIFAKVFTLETYAHKKGKIYAILSFGMISGYILGTGFGGYLWDYYGLAITSLIGIVLSAVCLVPLFFIQEPLKKRSKPKQFLKIKFTKEFTALSIHRFLSSALSSMIVTFALPLYLKNFFDVNIAKIGLIFLAGRTAMLFGLPTAKIVEKYDFRIVNLIGLLITSIGYGLISLLGSLTLVTLFIFIAYLGWGIATVTVPYYFDRISKKSHGRNVSLIDLGANMGWPIGSLISGFIIITLGYKALFPIFFVLMTLNSFFLFFVFGGKIKRKQLLKS